jgi:4-hydroxy-3-polyprenylbenzoate decarboxylase
MRPDDLHSFITLLDQADELVRIEVLVDPYLEIATIIDRVSKGAGRGRALLFEHVKGSEMPLAANLYGSLQRVAWAIGTTDLDGRVEKLAADMHATGETVAVSALRHLMKSPTWRPKAGDGDCFTVDITDQGLTALPVLQNWPGDGGRYITLGQVITRAPEGGLQNCGMYRVKVIDRRHAAIHWRPTSDGARHLAEWHAQKVPMPVAIALGGPPVLTWVAGLPLPEGVSEVFFAGYLTGEPLTLTSCGASDLWIPATAEIVIEGEIHPGEQHPEGPFGNHTGCYAPPTSAAVIRITRISCRDHAIYPCTLVGPPPMEDLSLAEAAARLLLPMLQYDHPWVSDVYLPREGIFHRGAIVAIAPAKQLPVEDITRALWDSILLKDARLLILLDAGEDLRDPAQVYWRVINGPAWDTRVVVDAQRLVIDARRSADGVWVHPDRATLQHVLKRWHEYGFED